MKIYNIILWVAFLFSLNSFGQSFPIINCKDIEGNMVSIPEDFLGRKMILFLAQSREAETELIDWYETFYTLFLDQNGFNSMAYDCDVKLLIMFSGSSQVAAKKVISSIKANVEEDMTNFLLFFEGSVDDNLQMLNLKKKEHCAIFVLDEKGETILQLDGKYSESKIEQISKLVEID